MKVQKLLIALPLVALLSGCNAVETADKTYHTSKDYFVGYVVNPILDKIDGGEYSVKEPKIEKAARLFKATFGAENAHFNIVKITKETEEYKSYVFADGKYQVSTFLSADALASGRQRDIILSTIYTSSDIYDYSGNVWSKKPSSESTLIDFSCYNSVAKTLMESDPINLIDSFGIKENSNVYSSSGALNMSYDETVFESYTCTMFLTFELNTNKTNVSSAKIMIRKNTKLIGAEEAVGETIEYNIDVVSLSENKIKLPNDEQEETEEPEQSEEPEEKEV